MEPDHIYLVTESNYSKEKLTQGYDSRKQFITITNGRFQVEDFDAQEAWTDILGPPAESSTYADRFDLIDLTNGPDYKILNFTDDGFIEAGHIYLSRPHIEKS